ncbi:MAG TPA: hypothetical protein VNO22_17810 [Planctomycetota bacterium]|nr:hypothetical protein [Planctomycetota bacterium]
MTPRPLWELSCAAKDAVLSTSFTWQELELLAREAGVPLEDALPGESPARAPAVLNAAHNACADRNPFSERLQDILEAVHEEAVLRVATTSTDEILERCLQELADLPVPLAGFLWAVLTDPRESMRPAESCLLWRIHTEGARALAFGRVEVIEVGP